MGAMTASLRGWLLLILPMLFVSVAPAPTHLQARQTWTGIWSREFSTYGCKPIIFIYARETIGPGNLGFWVGPEISNRLKLYFGVENVATEGVDYLGLVDTNFYLGGAPPVAIGLMQILLTKAVTQCPYSKIIAAGYSQGAAVTHRAIQFLPQETRDRITAVVTFGDTQTLQDGGRIIGYPVDKTLIICNEGDVVCTGTLWVFPTHFDYTKRVPEAVHWLIWRVLSSYFNPNITPWYWGPHGIVPAPVVPPEVPPEEEESGGGEAGDVGGGNVSTTAHPEMGTMPLPEVSLFPSIPVGDAAPTVTVEAGSGPSSVPVEDMLSLYPELSGVITAVPTEQTPSVPSSEVEEATATGPPQATETAHGECKMPREFVEEMERRREKRPGLFSFWGRWW